MDLAAETQAGYSVSALPTIRNDKHRRICTYIIIRALTRKGPALPASRGDGCGKAKLQERLVMAFEVQIFCELD